MNDGSALQATDATDNQIYVGGRLGSSGTNWIRCKPSAKLLLDNSAVIASDQGTLLFEGPISWDSTAKAGEYEARGTNSSLRFSTSFQIPEGVTTHFTGPGTNRVETGATVTGIAQVGGGLQGASEGNLAINGQITGTGSLRIIGLSLPAGRVIWEQGTVELPDVEIQKAGELLVAGLTTTLHEFKNTSIANGGTVSLKSRQLTLAEETTFENLEDALFLADGEALLFGKGTNSAPIFENRGLFSKTGNGVVSFQEAAGGPGPVFNNSGEVEVEAGALNLLTGTNSGAFKMNPEGTLAFTGGLFLLETNTTFEGQGLVRVIQGSAPASLMALGQLSIPAFEVGSNGVFVASGRSNSIDFFDILTCRDNGTVLNGTFIATNMYLVGDSLLTNCSGIIQSSFEASGNSCTLAATQLILGHNSQGYIGVPENRDASLILESRSILAVQGQLRMLGTASIQSRNNAENMLLIGYRGMLTCTNTPLIT
ncbi:MAG: hypothetical protein EG828_14090, partial [Deltaproteobacteria bacterium]|nr:hypothetical protein [Deltaproteobacteria bacterium]